MDSICKYMCNSFKFLGSFHLANLSDVTNCNFIDVILFISVEDLCTTTFYENITCYSNVSLKFVELLCSTMAVIIDIYHCHICTS